jgi:hypothetical protein
VTPTPPPIIGFQMRVFPSPEPRNTLTYISSFFADIEHFFSDTWRGCRQAAKISHVPPFACPAVPALLRPVPRRPGGPPHRPPPPPSSHPAMSSLLLRLPRDLLVWSIPAVVYPRRRAAAADRRAPQISSQGYVIDLLSPPLSMHPSRTFYFEIYI